MHTFWHSIRCTAFAALLCLTTLPTHGQAGTTHKGYRGHGAQVTYPSFLTVTEVDPDTVSFLFEGSGFLLQKADSTDLPSIMKQLRDSMPPMKFKITSTSATQMEAVGENGWFIKSVAILDQGSIYILSELAPLQLRSFVDQQFADVQRTLVFDGKSTFGQGGGLTPSSAGCPGCAGAVTNTMNNLTRNTAGH